MKYNIGIIISYLYIANFFQMSGIIVASNSSWLNYPILLALADLGDVLQRVATPTVVPNPSELTEYVKKKKKLGRNC